MKLPYENNVKQPQVQNPPTEPQPVVPGTPPQEELPPRGIPEESQPIEEQTPQGPSVEEEKLSLTLFLRKLKDVEHQMITSVIKLKNDKNLNGIMSEEDILAYADELKYTIVAISDRLIHIHGFTNAEIKEIFNIVGTGKKSYEFWLVHKKK
jgi:hypothetical protein|tara:strand:+ start:3704 stop:4159 length:456 start_codon:yes stop_codon:yes gene_type:complete